jgi:transcriptional regulator with XRE-family HTH domain
MELKLNDFLSKKGLTQTDLANKLGVSPIYVNRWCNGKVLPSLTYFFEISKILKVKMEDLIK